MSRTLLIDCEDRPLKQLLRTTGTTCLLDADQAKLLRITIAEAIDRKTGDGFWTDLREIEHVNPNAITNVRHAKSLYGSAPLAHIAKRAFVNEPEDVEKSFAELHRAVFDLLRSRSSIATPERSNLPSIHAIHFLILAILEGGQTTTEELQGELGVGPEYLQGVVHGYAAGPPAPLSKLARLVREYSILKASDLREFLDQPNTLAGWRHQLGLADVTSPSGKMLRSILNRKVKFAEKEWLRCEHEKAKRVKFENPGYIKDLKEIYFHSAIHLGTEEMLDAAVADFGHERWQSIVNTDPEPPANHLGYSNKLLGEWVSDMLIDDLLHRTGGTRPHDEFTIIEGGVGGAHTTYWLMKEMSQRLDAGKNGWKIFYKGFEIVYEVALRLNDIVTCQTIGNKGKADSRASLYAHLYPSGKLVPLQRWDGDNRFIDNCRMESGVMGLTNCVANSTPIFHGRVDAFITSYAFHHVPNGEKLKAFLDGSAAYRDLPTLKQMYRFNEKESEKERRRFQKNLLEAIPEIMKRANAAGFRSTVTKWLQHVGIGPSNVFLSLFEPNMLHKFGDLSQFLTMISELPSRGWKMPREQLDLVLRNPQQVLLQNVFKLLRPGGVLAIADPDGTSSFNAERIAEDPEITIANFLNLHKMQKLLTSVGFEIEFGRAVTVKCNDDVFGHYSGDPKIGEIVQKRIGQEHHEDENLGYIVVVRKPKIIRTFYT